MADNKQSFQAGQTAGHAEEKSNVVIDKVKDAIGAGGAGGGAGTTAQQTGQKISEATGGAVNVVKEKTGTNK